MLRSPAPHKILMIGGASSGTLKEFEKYRDVRVDYVDVNPAVVEILKKGELPDVRFYVSDPWRFLKSTDEKYDVVILNTGLPHNLQDNRFFTEEFFRLVKNKLNEGGVFGVKGPEKQFHREPAYVACLSIIASTGKSVFKNYDVFPGHYVRYLFTEGKLLPLFDKRYKSVFDENQYFNPDYILPDLIEDERTEYLNEIKLNMAVNTNLRPVLLEQSIVAKSGYWHVDRYLYIYIVAGLFVLAVVVFKRRVKTMAIAGFALAGVQLLLVYMMQIVAGNIYEAIGFLFALSMAGMALGGFAHRKLLPDLKISPEVILLITGMLILLLPFVFRVLDSVSGPFVLQVLFVYFLVFIFAFAGGGLFSVISVDKNADSGELAGSLYGADLIGSSAGLLLTSLFFIPVAGMVNTAFILGALCVVGGLMFIRG
jgi:spermidine synthase